MVVYSRWCGELISDIQHCGAKRGLSPLARGTLISLAIINRLTRFIPAGAGNSRARGDSGRACTVYPAGAGNSRVCSAPCSTNSVYPRWRGELKVAGTPRAVNVGLSRWRGELTKHNLLLIIDFLSQSQSTNLTETHKQHIHYVKEHLIH